MTGRPVGAPIPLAGVVAMGSCMSYGDYTCEQCGWDGCVADDHYRRLEIYIWCGRCGWKISQKPKIDRAHEKRTGSRRWLRARDGHYIGYTYRRCGYGTYVISTRKGGATCGAFHAPVDQQTVDQFRRLVSGDEVDEQRSFLARWNPETREVENVVGQWYDPYRDGESGSCSDPCE